MFHLPTGVTIADGTKLTLSKPYSTKSVNDIFNNDSESVLTKNLGQLLTGTRDTNSLFLTDAYLCAWSPNLGRPHTFYSDASRTWITNGVKPYLRQSQSITSHTTVCHSTLRQFTIKMSIT